MSAPPPPLPLARHPIPTRIGRPPRRTAPPPHRAPPHPCPLAPPPHGSGRQPQRCDDGPPRPTWPTSRATSAPWRSEQSSGASPAACFAPQQSRPGWSPARPRAGHTDHPDRPISSPAARRPNPRTAAGARPNHASPPLRGGPSQPSPPPPGRRRCRRSVLTISGSWRATRCGGNSPAQSSATAAISPPCSRTSPIAGSLIRPPARRNPRDRHRSCHSR